MKLKQGVLYSLNLIILIFVFNLALLTGIGFSQYPSPTPTDTSAPAPTSSPTPTGTSCSERVCPTFSMLSARKSFSEGQPAIVTIKLRAKDLPNPGQCGIKRIYVDVTLQHNVHVAAGPAERVFDQFYNDCPSQTEFEFIVQLEYPKPEPGDPLKTDPYRLPLHHGDPLFDGSKATLKEFRINIEDCVGNTYIYAQSVIYYANERGVVFVPYTNEKDCVRRMSF